MNTKVFHKIGNVLAKNSPTILTGVAVTGLISTSVMTGKAVLKADELLYRERYRRSEGGSTPNFASDPLPIKDTIKLTYKCYIPAVIMGGVTIVCIICANSVNLKRNAALAGAYSLSAKALEEYQAKVVETFGQTKHKAVKDEIAKDKVVNNPVVSKEIIITGNGETLCYDMLSGRYFKSDIEKIRSAINKLNRDMMSEMSISLNQVYYEFGLSETKLGDSLGWHIDSGLIEPSFSSQLAEDGTPCLTVDFETEPRYIYYE